MTWRLFLQLVLLIMWTALWVGFIVRAVKSPSKEERDGRP